MENTECLTYDDNGNFLRWFQITDHGEKRTGRGRIVYSQDNMLKRCKR
jgi:hypothetical protein